MQQRRSEVAEEAGRRQRRTIFALLVVTVGAIGSMFLVQSSWMDVDQIVITGAIQSDVFEIRDAAGIEAGDPLLELDLGQAGESVSNLAWIDTAWVERKLDGTVTIHVEERVPVAALPTPVGLVLLDRSGRQLETVDVAPTGFVPIHGIEASGIIGTPAPPAAQGAMHLISALGPELSEKIDSVYFEGNELNLALRGGGHVLMGTDSGLTDKLVSLETMLSKVDLRCLWQIDLRVPTAPALLRVSGEGEIGAALTNLADCS